MDKKISGMMHVRLPFSSMDDVSFEGAGSSAAKSLMDTLRDHLSKSDSVGVDDQDPQDDVLGRAVGSVRKEVASGSR